MKLVSLLLVAGATWAAVATAQDDSLAGSASAGSASTTTKPSTNTTKPSTKPSKAPVAGNGASALDGLTPQTYPGEWHMSPVRVIHARVQSDTPQLVEGRFVSSYGNGDLAAGYLSAMDTVNTASVEGALMYVQAEGINQNSRAEDDRCVRKNNMKNIVFYEILIAQTNETIAEFGSSWKGARDTFEYGPMAPMDAGRCTPESSGKKEKLPTACLQYNGEGGEASLGPFVGGGIKDDDVRAPYPDTYWFSFPNTCPNMAWGKKTEECRATTRKGLCDIGQAPDGVACTFAYDIIGWVTIDDVVGITSIGNKETGEPYANFTEWCQASTKNIEFAGDDKTGEMKSGLKFWNKPLDKTANSQRASKVVEVYNKMVSGKFESTQIDSTLVANFKPLPSIETLRDANPPCYQSVPKCNRGNGCRREGYSQLCKPCSELADGCTIDSSFEFPKLTKAKRGDDLESEDGSNTGSVEGSAVSDGSDDTEIDALSPSATTTDDKDSAYGSVDKPAPSASASVRIASAATVAVASVLALAL
ncbi:hypothetical protein Poli38472_003243 [Pythium oligandrum]|uniref:Uncharacterized protein n=1 Tax=Pythium oligandrum TaxID=41045 RepID=A0A8K1C6H2_PYTOL|nr:hypothetical protein Poli38472_003243 [Pythium oligandrum]|eukprot:TMW57318.1 hypothetical protein Poli38472_003243 [Pythium oligandrum]